MQSLTRPTDCARSLADGRHVGRIALATVTAFAAVQAVPARSSDQRVSSSVASQPIVAWPSDEPVPAGTSREAVVAALASDRIVASETGNHVGAGCTDDDVVPRCAQTRLIRHTVDRASRRKRLGDCDAATAAFYGADIRGTSQIVRHAIDHGAHARGQALDLVQQAYIWTPPGLQGRKR